MSRRSQARRVRELWELTIHSQHRVSLAALNDFVEEPVLLTCIEALLCINGHLEEDAFSVALLRCKGTFDVRYIAQEMGGVRIRSKKPTLTPEVM